MILLISLILDLILLTIKTIHSRKMIVFLRFIAMSTLINTFAHYINEGLSITLGENLLLAIVCTITAKIFIIYLYLQYNEAEQRNIPIYVLTVLLSLCLQDNPIRGLLSCTILLLFLLYMEHHVDMLPQQESVLVHREESDLYLKTIEESYRKNRALMHDLKNHIIVLRSLAEEKEYDMLLDYTDAMAEKVSGSLFPVHTGNTILDALLADKYNTARRYGIFIEFLSIHYNVDFDSWDLCTVIGNLLDNAIAENLKTTCTKERRISVSIITSEEELTVEIKNPLFHTLKVQNGLPVTDKPDLEHHGIGLKNVQRVCDVYGGTLLWDDTDGVFTVTVQLKMTQTM